MSDSSLQSKIRKLNQDNEAQLLALKKTYDVQMAALDTPLDEMRQRAWKIYNTKTTSLKAAHSKKIDALKKRIVDET